MTNTHTYIEAAKAVAALVINSRGAESVEDLADGIVSNLVVAGYIPTETEYGIRTQVQDGKYIEAKGLDLDYARRMAARHADTEVVRRANTNWVNVPEDGEWHRKFQAARRGKKK